MSIPVIQPRAFYGLQTGITGNANYITDNDVLYPAAGILIIHNFAQRRQRYIRLLERQKELNIICVSPNKRYVALAEKGEKPSISLYDLGNLKRKKLLNLPPDSGYTATQFTAIGFSHEGKYLYAVLGDPDWMLLSYNWERGKLDSFTKANTPNNPTGAIVQVVGNPTDNTVVVLLGPGIFRLLTYQENLWRQFGFTKSENFPLSCATWLNFDRMLLGTTDGRILFVEGGDLKGVYKAAEVNVLNLKAKEDDLASLSEPSLVTSTESVADSTAVAELISFPRGFAFACGPGTVILFEKETNHKYTKRNVFRILDEDFLDRPPPEMHLINCMCINLIQDTLLVTTPLCQLYTVRLWGLDLTHAAEIPFKILGDILPNGYINGLAMCAWKPIFVTTGEDRTIRVWNFQTETQDLIRQYPEAINCISLHPTGLYVLVGFADKLRFMVLSVEDLQTTREFNVRNCCACAFSLNGHMFAAMNGNIIQIYSTISLEVIHMFKGHNNKVTSLKWVVDDKMMVSCGIDGAVYEWEVESGKRKAEVVTKTIKYLDCVPSADGRCTFAIADDFELKEIAESAINRNVNLIDASLTSLTISRSGLMLFVGAAYGGVLSLKFPLSEPPEYNEYFIHNKPVTKMCLSYDDHVLVTVSEDGSVCIWKLTFTEGKTVKMEKEFKYSTEILVSRDDLKNKIQELRDLALRLRELEAEHGYQMRQTEANNNAQIKEIHEHYYEALKELKDKNEQLEVEHTTEISIVNSEIAKMKQTHESAMQTLETTYNAKLILEYDKYTLLEEKLLRVKEDYIDQLDKLGTSKDEEIRNLTDNYVMTMRDKNVQLEELREETCHQMKEHEEIKQQIEDDTDREIVDLRTHYESLLCDERETNTRLRGESGIIKKKFISASKEVDEYKHTVHTLSIEHQKFQTTILALERDVSDLKKEIVERDNTISDKEKRIYELKRKNQELEKYKFVLNYKITELKSQIEPKDREIKEKKDQICDMELELENLQKTNTNLELQINELREKLNAADNENDKEKRRNRESDAVLRRIRIDLHNAAGLLQEPKKLKDAVKALYHTYSQDKDIVATRGGDEDVQKEFMRQRQHLEHTVAALRKQVEKQMMTSKSSGEVRLMQENCTLIEEVNQLRKELKVAQRHITDMESVLGLSSKFMSPKEARMRLDMAVKSKEEIQADSQRRVDACEKKIIILKEEIKRLIAKLPETEQLKHKRQEKDLKVKHMNEITEFQEYLQVDPTI